jgi:hypothetical protein
MAGAGPEDPMNTVGVTDSSKYRCVYSDGDKSTSSEVRSCDPVDWVAVGFVCGGLEGTRTRDGGADAVAIL